MNDTMEHAQHVSAAGSGPTAAPPAASTQQAVHARLQLMRENMEKIHELLGQVTVLAQENSEMICLCEALVVKTHGYHQ
jgi:hypothetical protein